MVVAFGKRRNRCLQRNESHGAINQQSPRALRTDHDDHLFFTILSRFVFDVHQRPQTQHRYELVLQVTNPFQNWIAKRSSNCGRAEHNTSNRKRGNAEPMFTTLENAKSLGMVNVKIFHLPSGNCRSISWVDYFWVARFSRPIFV